MAGKGTVGQLLVEMRADLGKLRVDVKEMENVFKSSFSNVTGMAKSFGAILGASFSAGAIIAYGKHIVDLGGQLKDLSQQTGISGQTLSGLKSTLEENGTSLDAFAKGIFTLQKNLGGIKNESDPAAEAVKALGLNLKVLREADTETFLELVTDALGNVTNPLNRAALGSQLLAKSWRELGPAILEMSGRLAELRKNGISDEDIEILDRWGDSWTKIQNRIEVFLAGEMSQLIQDLDHMGTLLQKGYLYWKQFWAGAFHEGFINTEDIKNQLAELEGPQSHTPATERGKFKPPVDTEAVKKLADAIKKVKGDTESFIDGLQKQNLALELSQLEIDHTAEEIKKLELEQEKSAFINKTLRDSLAKTIPPELLAKIDQWNAKLIENTKKIAEQKRFIEEMQALSKAWVKDIDAIKTAEQEWADIKFSPEAQGMDDLSKSLDEISKKYVQVIVKAQAMGAAAKAAPEEIETVVRRLKIDQALEQVRARVGFTGEGADPLKEARERGEALGAELGDSISSGLKNTLLGIETGDQSIGEGMKNLVRNMMLELQGVMLDKAIIAPLKSIAEGFMGGLAEAMNAAADDSLKDMAHNVGMKLGGWLKEALGSGGSSGGIGSSISSGMSSVGSWIASLFMEKGGMIPSFASGGLFIGHGGEFVMQKKAVDNIGADTLGMMNKTGKMPSGGSVVNVEINGDITPRQPNMTPDQVVKVTAGNITNDGMVMSAIEQRLRLRGK